MQCIPSCFLECYCIRMRCVKVNAGNGVTQVINHSPPTGLLDGETSKICPCLVVILYQHAQWTGTIINMTAWSIWIGKSEDFQHILECCSLPLESRPEVYILQVLRSVCPYRSKWNSWDTKYARVTKCQNLTFIAHNNDMTHSLNYILRVGFDLT